MKTFLLGLLVSEGSVCNEREREIEMDFVLMCI